MGDHMNRFAFGLAAAVLLAVSGGQAFADDYVALCKASEQGNPDADKVCNCASGKLAGADRTAAMTALKAINDAMSKGKTPDASADISKGVQAQATAEAACM